MDRIKKAYGASKKFVGEHTVLVMAAVGVTTFVVGVGVGADLERSNTIDQFTAFLAGAESGLDTPVE